MADSDCSHEIKKTLALWKKRYFWTVVLEKTQEPLGLQGDPTSPSSRKSTLNIHWKDWCWSWNSCTFGDLMQRTDSFEKSLMLGKIEGRRRRGWGRVRWLDRITDSMEMSLGELRELATDREAWRAVWFMGSQRVGHDWETELNWTEHNPETITTIKVTHTDITSKRFFQPSLFIFIYFPSVTSNMPQVETHTVLVEWHLSCVLRWQNVFSFLLQTL